MTTLTVTAKGQVTLRKNLREHLGIRLGDKIEVDLLPNGRAELHAPRKKPARSMPLSAPSTGPEIKR